MRNLSGLSDEALVRAYALGDNEAFDTLLERHQQNLFSYILQMVRDRDLADDIFQETFIKAITTIKQNRYNELGKFAPWIFRIARNLVVDTFRADKTDISLSADAAGYDVLNRRDPADLTAEDMMIDLQIEEDIRSLIEALPENQQEVLQMRYYRDMSFKEIAEATGVSINTALGRMHYAVLNLRKMVKDKNLSLTR